MQNGVIPVARKNRKPIGSHAPSCDLIDLLKWCVHPHQTIILE